MQKHLDTSTIRHTRQDGIGPDKSTALSLSYTQMGIASNPDLGIANDGLLAGRELESDAELLANWGDTLNRKDRLAFGWVDPATDSRPTDSYRLFNSRTQVSRHLGAIEYERCPEYAKFRLTGYDGDTTVKGRGCGASGCPACRHNRHLRDRGKPYAAGVGDLITDLTITGDPTMAIGAGSPWANLRNAHREICDVGAVRMLGPGFSQRIILDGIMDDLGKHVQYLRSQPGVTKVTVTIGEPPTFAELHEWMGENEEWHHGKQRWRFYKWPAEKLPRLRAPYSDDIENATDEDIEMGDTPAVAQLKAYVMAAAPGPERDAAVKVAELTIVQGYINRGANLSKVWIRALTDAAGRLTCVEGTCRCDITDRGRKRHIDAAKRRWTPAMHAVAAYVGDARLKQLANMALK